MADAMNISWLSVAFAVIAVILLKQRKKLMPTRLRRWLTGYQIIALLINNLKHIVYGISVIIARFGIGLVWLGIVLDQAAHLFETTKILVDIQDQDIPAILILEAATLWGTYLFTHWMVLFGSYQFSLPGFKKLKKGLRRGLRRLALPLPIVLQVLMIFRVCFSSIIIDYFTRSMLCIMNNKHFWEKDLEIDEVISENVYGIGTGPLYPKTYSVSLDKIWKLKI